MKKALLEQEKKHLSKKRDRQGTVTEQSLNPKNNTVAENPNRLFNEQEFLQLGDYWVKQGLIRTEDYTLIQQTLADREARKLLELWSLVFPVSMTVNYFRDSATATVGIVTQNVWQSLKTYFGAFLGLSAVQGSFAAWYLKGFKSQKIVPLMYFIPILGAFAPLGYLTKEHGRFLHLLWAYLHSRFTLRQQNQNPPRGKLQAHMNNQNLKQDFQIAMNRISPLLSITDGIWKIIETIINTSDKKN